MTVRIKSCDRKHSVMLYGDSVVMAGIQYPKDESFFNLQGDIFSPDSLKPCLEGADCILSCLGVPSYPVPFTTVTFYMDSIRAIVGAMEQSNSTCRLIVMSSMGSKHEPGIPIFLEWIFKVKTVKLG